MALDFNNQAVAESYSLREAMRLMMQPEHDFFHVGQGKKNIETRKWFRNAVIQMVLATDMSRHFELLGQFEAQVANNKELKQLQGEDKWLAMTDAQQLLVLQIAIKVCYPAARGRLPHQHGSRPGLDSFRNHMPR
jgi:hypothetical protein